MIVPTKPTNEMLAAARKHHEGEPYLPVALYIAMVEAAPHPCTGCQNERAVIRSADIACNFCNRYDLIKDHYSEKVSDS